MKKLIVSLLLLICVLAFANPPALASATAYAASASVPREGAPTASAKLELRPEPIPVVKLGKIKVQIYKSTVTQGSDQTYQWDRVPICTAESTVNIHDVRSPNSNGYFTPTYIKCASTLHGQPVEVRFSSFSFWNSQKLFSDEAQAEFQYVNTTLMVMSAGQVVVPNSISGAVASRGLNATSMIGNLDISSVVSCSPDACKINIDEFFTASFEFTN